MRTGEDVGYSVVSFSLGDIVGPSVDMFESS